jgi:hypothetical protein
MSVRSEYDAAYFTLLRAREEHDRLLRYREFLEAEQRRLEAFARDIQHTTEVLPRQLRHPIDATTKPLLEAVGRRRSVVLSELAHMDDRIANADAFVQECEAEVASLRG